MARGKANGVQMGKHTEKAPRRWLRFSIRAMLVVIAGCCLCLAIWVGRSERQRRAVSALRSVEITEVYYDFDPMGPHPDLQRILNPIAVPNAPGWLSQLIGIDYFHRAVQVHVALEDVEWALPHLKRLPSLRHVYVFDNDEQDARLNAAIERLRIELPRTTVEVGHGHGVEISRIPVVG